MDFHNAFFIPHTLDPHSDRFMLMCITQTVCKTVSTLEQTCCTPNYFIYRSAHRVHTTKPHTRPSENLSTRTAHSHVVGRVFDTTRVCVCSCIMHTHKQTHTRTNAVPSTIRTSLDERKILATTQTHTRTLYMNWRSTLST